jgi:aryl-alcohol dehydrogenase-like predicted oxidoreductase
VKINVNGGESRRAFLKGVAMTGAVSVISAASAKGQNNGPGGQSAPIVPNAPAEKEGVAEFQAPQRAMGKTGLQVSILGVGGYHLGAVAGQAAVNDLIAKALDHGINFFDNAWEYYKGASEERLGTALKGKRDKAIVMTKVCTHGRKKDIAMQMLEESLTRLHTDHLDVWQVHEVVYYNDPEKCYAPDGVLEALAAAKQQGKVRFVGFTGHKNPSIHLAMLKGGFPFDTVQMPLNPFDYSYRSFQREVLPVAAQRGMAVFGMKSMGGSGEMISQGALTPTEALTFAMSLPGVSTTISGMDSMRVLDQNLEILRTFKPLSEDQISALRNYAKQFDDGRFELFKSTVKYDGDLGRTQHDYPAAAELPA